jgi:hypothetical protein
MAHFAKLDENNVVVDVNVVHNNELLDENGNESEANGLEFLINWSNGYTNWKQTSYNANFRKNYAVIGGTYDPIRDAFITPKEYPSWVLNEDTCRWEPPVPRPSDDKFYIWDEPSLNWVAITE